MRSFVLAFLLVALFAASTEAFFAKKPTPAKAPVKGAKKAVAAKKPVAAKRVAAKRVRFPYVRKGLTSFLPRVGAKK